MENSTSSNDAILLQPFKAGDIELRNRVVCASLTRTRADPNGVATDLNVEYYSLRGADAGLILTECSAVRADGNAFPGSIGAHNDEQFASWKRVVDAIHEKGGKVALQIWHGGRAVHPDHIGGVRPVSASAIAINGTVHTPLGRKNHEVPRELPTDEVKQLVKEFRVGAEKAKASGFDGIQLHGAHGYLVSQFLADNINKRTDEYGGSLENKCRFLLEILDELIAVFGPAFTGIKLSPICDYNDFVLDDPFATMEYLIEQFNQRNLGFIEINEAPSLDGVTHKEKLEKFWSKNAPYTSLAQKFKASFKGIWIKNFLLDFETANKDIEEGRADLCSFGTPYVCNANLAERFAKNLPLNGIQYITPPQKIFQYFYQSSDALGYTDLSVYEPPKEQPAL